MKISYINWQQLDLSVFRPALDETLSDGSEIFDSSFDDSSIYDGVTSYSNSSIRGNWSGFTYQVKGSSLLGSNPTITALIFTSASESFNVVGRISSNDEGETLNGFINKINYTNSISNNSFSFSGRANLDSFQGTLTYIFSGNKFSYTGNFITSLDDDFSPDGVISGTVTGFSFEDTQGNKISVSDLSIEYSTFKSLTSNSSNISNLYAALSFDGNDTITGTSGNDTLDGEGGVDTLIGGAGNDTYVVDLLSNGALQDKVTEAKNAGVDTLELRGDLVLSNAVNIKLGKNVENLDISLTNNSLLNLTGDNVANTLTGNAANNVIDGGKGADTMIGGDGNDTYVLDNAGDIVIEASNAGIDQVNIKFNGSYTLGDNVENGFIAHGKAFTLNGNALDNVLTGGSGKNILDGGVGNDTLTGGKGADTFVFKLADAGSAGAPSSDTIADFTIKQKDVLDLRDLLSSADETDLNGLLNFIDVTTDGTNTQLHISSSGGFASGTYDASAEDATITLANVNLLSGTDESALLQNLINKNQLLLD